MDYTAAALIAERQAADRADLIAPTLSRSAVADETSHQLGIQFRRPGWMGEFVDHDPDGSFHHVRGRSAYCPARRGFNFGICQQIAIPAFEHDQQAVEVVSIWRDDGFFVLRDRGRADVYSFGELLLCEAAIDADAAKPGGTELSRPVRCNGTHVRIPDVA
jgi:hypothetical protein